MNPAGRVRGRDSYSYTSYGYGGGYYGPAYRSAYYGGYRPVYRPAVYGGYRVARGAAIQRDSLALSRTPRYGARHTATASPSIMQAPDRRPARASTISEKRPVRSLPGRL